MDKLKYYIKEIISSCQKSGIVENQEVSVYEDVVVNIRIILEDSSFIEVYYNIQTSKESYAWIKNNKRIYGADNLGGWHIHPLNNPEKHIKSSKISFANFLKRIEKEINK